MKGVIKKISGPLVLVEGLENAKMYNVVLVGKLGLMGEIVRIKENTSYVQVYESTLGLRPGEPVKDTGMPFIAELGPGLLSSIYDGVQRPLKEFTSESDFILRGMSIPSLDRKKKWNFKPLVSEGDHVAFGSVLGIVKELGLEHRIMVPRGISGKVGKIKVGSFKVTDKITTVGGSKITLMQKWPIRLPRPISEKLPPKKKLRTGLRSLDSLFTISKGGSAALSGGFGVGKTVVLQSIAKFSDFDVVIYVGCGERGNEMADLLDSFSKLKKGELPLLNRTTLIANTSNMPVTARESSIYLGATIGEYYRDMGYHVGVISDSTSRWAEALREINSRLGEMPGEQGYPANLSSRIAAFYERAGVIRTFSNATGSLTLLGAISPPGGDFSEPVTQNTLKVVRTFISLNKKLSSRRHFPAIDWTSSYSLDGIGVDFPGWAFSLLNREAEIEEVVQLIGPDALQDKEKLVLLIGKLIREGFLQQNAFSKDAFCTEEKSEKIMKAIEIFKDFSFSSLANGASFEEISSNHFFMEILRLKNRSPEEFESQYKSLEEMLL
ncbi:MAG: V-type ATP synthase subunit A [Candidatus Altiarchaeota archaeon]|nr:V-type ATP synthase subunit A [Candidatus Altiarchaeota archaeon]